MSGFTNSTDAQVWAEEFVKVMNSNPGVVDEEFMTSWFANAIMAGYDEARRKYEMVNYHEVTMRHVLGEA